MPYATALVRGPMFGGATFTPVATTTGALPFSMRVTE